MKLALNPVLISSVFVALAATGCSTSDATTGSTTGDTPDLKADATYSAGPFMVESGKELVMCTYVKGTNEQEEDITAFVTEQSKGGHHLIVYTIDHDVELPPSPCSQGGQPSWSQILVTQIEKEQSVFPTGVGFRVKPHQQYVMETHYINTGSTELKVNSDFGTVYGKPGSVTTRAATYFFGTMNIDILPNSKAHAEAHCSVPQGMTLQTMFGHEHRHGTGVSVDLMPAAAAAKNVYQTDLWDNPPIKTFDGGLDVAMNDKMHVACDWTNNEANGFRYPHEMCFAIGYYWPAQSAIQCIAGGGKDECMCTRQGSVDTGPGGGHVELDVHRLATVANVKGAVDKGAPIYCALYHAEDWKGALPDATALPRYFRDSVDTPLATDKDVVTIDLPDVTPGDYKSTCYMDTIGGGFIPGTGDLLAIQAHSFTVTKSEKTTVDVTLDFAYP